MRHGGQRADAVRPGGAGAPLLLDELDDTARGIGAVNTVLNENGTLVGSNTDAPGFRIAAEREVGVRLAGAAVTVVGAGVTAHAVAHACVDGGASTVTVANRTPERAVALAARFARCRPVALSDPAAALALRGTDLLVNASTAGMTSDDCPVDVALLPASAAVYDCVYTPAERPLLRAARVRGSAAPTGSACSSSRRPSRSPGSPGSAPTPARSCAQR